MSLKGKVSPELKIQAVEDYLSGGGSLDTMYRKYEISAHAVLQQWITLYDVFNPVFPEKLLFAGLLRLQWV